MYYYYYSTSIVSLHICLLSYWTPNIKRNGIVLWGTKTAFVIMGIIFTINCLRITNLGFKFHLCSNFIFFSKLCTQLVKQLFTNRPSMRHSKRDVKPVWRALWHSPSPWVISTVGSLTEVPRKIIWDRQL